MSLPFELPLTKVTDLNLNELKLKFKLSTNTYRNLIGKAHKIKKNKSNAIKTSCHANNCVPY